MRLNPISSTNVSFGYKSILKDYYKQGLLPTVKYGFYGGYLTKSSVSLEHIIPHSRGGGNCLENFALATTFNNSARGNSPLIQYFKRPAALEYLKQFLNIKLPGFSGQRYIEGILYTLKTQGIKMSMEEIMAKKAKI